MISFDFLGKALRITYPQQFLCIAIVCFPGRDVINFEFNIIFLIKPFLYMAKSTRQKFKCLEKEKSF